MDSRTIIELRGLQGNEPTHLSGLQTVLAEHVEVLRVIWLILFFASLLFVCIRMILMPLLRQKH